jgi:hypothetical protein
MGKSLSKTDNKNDYSGEPILSETVRDTLTVLDAGDKSLK